MHRNLVQIILNQCHNKLLDIIFSMLCKYVKLQSINALDCLSINQTARACLVKLMINCSTCGIRWILLCTVPFMQPI